MHVTLSECEPSTLADVSTSIAESKASSSAASLIDLAYLKDVNNGEVFTRPWIVDLVLDLVEYKAGIDLAEKTIVEPSCGTGAFLAEIVRRLSTSLKHHGKSLEDAAGSIKAWDLLVDNVEASKKLVVEVLQGDGWGKAESIKAAEKWISAGDFLELNPAQHLADFVVGNPPYVRLEEVEPVKLASYRATLKTMGGRSDLYIGFFEIGLQMLKPEGLLGFICADRWMKNQYGEKLRRMITGEYSVDATLILHDVDAFEEEVSAYPAITVLRNGKQGKSLIADTTCEFDDAQAVELIEWISESRSEILQIQGLSASFLPHWFDAEGSWPWGSPARMRLLEELNDKFLPLETTSTGTRIGIGVATGKDEVFVVKSAPVEKSRLLPLAMNRDTKSGNMNWSGTFLVNPWESDGTLVDLEKYPKLRAYFETHAEKLLNRNVAKRQASERSGSWYRTIDKVDSSLTGKQKLLFPDMKMTTHPVLETGETYPHHNLYYVVSEEWDMKVLGGLLLSKVAEFFVDCYAVKMRGGTLRFQSQYLRRIRVPQPKDISKEDAKVLAKAFEDRNEALATQVAMRIYGIKEIPE